MIKSTGGAAGFTADQISDMAGSLSAASGMSLFGDDDIQRGQNMLLTFTNIKETLPDATKVMLDMATAMGTDAESGAIALGKALNDPIEGISALTRVGVTFTDAQKEQIKTMVQAGDVAGAQKVILAELNKEFGGSAEAAAKADGGFAQFRDRMGELAESIGTRVLPGLNDLMAWLNSPEIQAAITGFVDGLFNGLSTIATAINDWVITPAKNVVAAFNEWKAFGTEWGIVAALQEIGDTFPVLQPLTDWLANQAPGLVQGVRQAFGLARDAFITFRDALAGEWHADPEKIHPLHEAVGEFGLMIRDEVIPRLIDLYKSLKEDAPIAWETFKQSIEEDVMPVLRDLSTLLNKQGKEDIPATEKDWVWFGGRVEQILNDAMWVASGWGEDLRDILDNTVDDAIWMAGQWEIQLERWETAIEKKVGEVVAWFTGLPARIREAIGDAGTILYQTGVAIVKGLINGINSMIGEARRVLNEIIGIINSIPIIPNIPTIPTAPSGGGGSGFGGRSVGSFTPLGGISGHPGGSVTSNVINIDARGATDPRGVADNVERAVGRLLGQRGELRLRTT